MVVDQAQVSRILSKPERENVWDRMRRAAARRRGNDIWCAYARSISEIQKIGDKLESKLGPQLDLRSKSFRQTISNLESYMNVGILKPSKSGFPYCMTFPSLDGSALLSSCFFQTVVCRFSEAVHESISIYIPAWGFIYDYKSEINGTKYDLTAPYTSPCPSPYCRDSSQTKEPSSRAKRQLLFD